MDHTTISLTSFQTTTQEPPNNTLIIITSVSATGGSAVVIFALIKTLSKLRKCECMRLLIYFVPLKMRLISRLQRRKVLNNNVLQPHTTMLRMIEFPSEVFIVQ